jgi:hypothetical protein
MLIQDRDEVLVYFRFDFVEDWDAYLAAVYTEGPSDLLGEFSPEVPTSSADLCFIDLNGSRQD